MVYKRKNTYKRSSFATTYRKPILKLFQYSPGDEARFIPKKDEVCLKVNICLNFA